jgi:photosynthetic reaction center cytochrome c subunit
MSSRVTALLALVVVALAGCGERPPIDTEQTGYRGTGIVQFQNPRLVPPPDVPPPALPPAAPGGPTAGEIYQNVQVLGHLSIGEFTRLMAAMTQWVSPEQGCNYCHVPTDLASDDIYTKVVSRRMLELTQYINTAHVQHVGETGVTCYTCHRGLNVPEEIWTVDPGPRSVSGRFAGWRDGQNIAAPAAGYASLPYDPYIRFLGEANDDIRVVPHTALPANTNDRNIKDTEHTYSLMMHLSESLGVNCTYCHNSRSFLDWDQSPPVRTTAWHGLRMVQDINFTFLDPLVSALPEHRVGVLGDAPKANCATCHQGLPKPLGGAAMAADYPELSAYRPQPDVPAPDPGAPPTE